MFPLTPTTILKAGWPALLFILLTLAVLALGAVMALRGCDKGSAQPDYLEDVKAQIFGDVERQRQENEAKIKALETEMYDLRVQVETLDAEVQESAKAREEIHDAIDNAGSIDDIDRILRAGIPGVSGRND